MDVVDLLAAGHYLGANKGAYSIRMWLMTFEQDGLAQLAALILVAEELERNGEAAAMALLAKIKGDTKE